MIPMLDLVLFLKAADLLLILREIPTYLINT